MKIWVESLRIRKKHWQKLKRKHSKCLTMKQINGSGPWLLCSSSSTQLWVWLERYWTLRECGWSFNISSIATQERSRRCSEQPALTHLDPISISTRNSPQLLIPAASTKSLSLLTSVMKEYPSRPGTLDLTFTRTYRSLQKNKTALYNVIRIGMPSISCGFLVTTWDLRCSCSNVYVPLLFTQQSQHLF